MRNKVIQIEIVVIILELVFIAACFIGLAQNRNYAHGINYYKPQRSIIRVIETRLNDSIKEIKNVEIDIPEEPEPEYEPLGQFELTSYCSCSRCCGGGANAITASGATVQANHTIAVDPDIIPLGSTVYIDGYGTYTAEDTGGVIKNNKIDIYFPSHEEAIQFGVQYADVYLVEEGL